MIQKYRPEMTTLSLHLLAMAAMLCDHVGLALLPQQTWMRGVGRIAFPIFAFLTVEGYFRTGNLKKYVQRLLLAAVLSEVPFDLMCSAALVDPGRQNVLWTFLIGLAVIWVCEKAENSRRETAVFCSVLGGVALALAAGTDYGPAGVLTVLIFYFFRDRTRRNGLLQALLLLGINVVLLSGPVTELSVFGLELRLYQQSLALLALLPIWLYRGRQGYHSKLLQYGCYAFYPAHMLVLALF